MVNTTTLSRVMVSDGETRSFDLTQDDAINVLGGRCRWIGNEYQATYNNYNGVNKEIVDGDMLFEPFRVQAPDISDSSADPWRERFAIGYQASYTRYTGKAEVYWKIVDHNGDTLDDGILWIDEEFWENPYLEHVYYVTSWSPNFDFNEAAYAEMQYLDHEPSDQSDADQHFFRWNKKTRVETPTKNPTVDGDGFATYSGNLYDNDATAWFSLSTLSEGTNTFNFSIGGSNSAWFELQYDWEYAAPDPLYTMRVQLGGTTYDLPLVDPNDAQLDYSNLRTQVNGEVVAADLVNPNNKDASPFRVNVPGKGIKAWRMA